MTRFLYNVIDSRTKWDTKINLMHHPNAHREILFWRDNLNELNGRDIVTNDLPFNFEVHSDASNDAVGVIVNTGMSCHKNLTDGERSKSSTWREVTAILYGLEVFEHLFVGTRVSWYTDNYAAAVIIKSGSGKLDLQSLALNIFHLTRRSRIQLKISWVPREYNTSADLLSKYVDVDDWEITSNFVFSFEWKMGTLHG